ncbi:MAG: LysE family translocator [Flavobacteriia bacterium]|jgi:threonine/homoserine/homoserine lactone efflux protein|nr:LysE family translocator [Flavobacteriia bacterium]
MSLLPFLIAAVALAITPGPGIAYVVARTVSGGRKEGLASCIGTGLGGLVHVIASALGVSLVIAQSAFAFSLVKYIGAAYLFYLGFRMFFSKSNAPLIEEVSPQGTRRAFIEGIAVEALNVKTALFFLAFLPQFTTPNEPLIFQLIVLGSICVALNTFVDVLAVLGAHRLLKASAKRAQRERVMVKTSGITMLGLGTYLALAERN